MSDRDPYQVLGLGRDATGAEVARAYRRLARAVHPDSRPGDPAAAGQFRSLSDAYGLLSDQARRADYDRQHPPRPAPRPHRSSPAGPDLWPLAPGRRPRPAGGPASGAALRAGPVHVQPPAPPGPAASASRPGVDPALARLYWWLLASQQEWPW
jgi:curved DNA-binding protein CbpA